MENKLKISDFFCLHFLILKSDR